MPISTHWTVEVATKSALPLMCSWIIARLPEPTRTQEGYLVGKQLDLWQTRNVLAEAIERLATFPLTTDERGLSTALEFVTRLRHRSSIGTPHLRRLHFYDVQPKVEDALRAFRDGLNQTAAQMAVKACKITLEYMTSETPRYEPPWNDQLVVVSATQSLWADIHDQPNGYTMLLPQNAAALCEFTQEILNQYRYQYRYSKKSAH